MLSSARRLGATAGLWCAAITLCASALAQTPQSPPAPQAPVELPKGLAPSDSSVTFPSGTESAPPPAPEQRLPDGTLAVPPLARVTDTAGVLSSAQRAELEAKLAAFEKARGAQIAVIVVPSTQPEPISDFANRIGGVWKIGRPDIGDGVLMVVAVKDRRAWISVARALEGAIPDVVAARITREHMGPRFAKGDFAAGLNAGVDAVMRRIEGEGLPTPAGIPRERVDAGESVLSLLIPIILVGAFVSAMLRRRMGVPGAALGGVGAGAVAGFILSSLLLGRRRSHCSLSILGVRWFRRRARRASAVRSFFQAAGAAEAEAGGVEVAVAGARAVAVIFPAAAAEAAGDTTCLLTS